MKAKFFFMSLFLIVGGLSWAKGKVSKCDYDISSLPVIVNKPGKWCLNKNLTYSNNKQDAITIQSNDVTIDGNSLYIKGPNNLDTVIRGIIAYDRQNITIKNIHIYGFHTGILFADSTMLAESSMYFGLDYLYNYTEPKSNNIVIKNVIVENPTLQGIHVRGNNFNIKDVHVIDVGPTRTYPHAFATGIYTVGNLCSIERNLVKLGNATGNGENVGIALYMGSGCRISNNDIVFDKWLTWGRNFGIWTKIRKGEYPLIENNSISGASYALGPFGLFRGNIATNVSCSLFVKRKHPKFENVDLGGNVAIKWIPGNGSMQGDGTCPDDIPYAESRYASNPGALSAYSVAIAWGEGGAATLVETFAWFIVAAHYKHELALKIVEGHRGYPDDVVVQAEIMAKKFYQVLNWLFILK